MLRIEVSKTDCRKGGESEVNNDNESFRFRVILKTILIHKCERVWVFISKKIRRNVPQGAQDIGEEEDENNETEYSENVHDVNLLHDLVIVFSVRFADIAIGLDGIIQSRSVNAFKQILELLQVQNWQEFAKSYPSANIQ